MSDTLDFLRKNRSRAAVPARDSSLIDSHTAQDNSESIVEIARPIELPDSQLKKNPVNAIETELNSLPEIARRSNIRIEAKLLEQAEQDFKKERITLETFFEAAYALVEQSPELKKQIFDEARSRKKGRDRAGQLRRDLARLRSY